MQILQKQLQIHLIILLPSEFNVLGRHSTVLWLPQMTLLEYTNPQQEKKKKADAKYWVPCSHFHYKKSATCPIQF